MDLADDLRDVVLNRLADEMTEIIAVVAARSM
jgi:hypothetical protein